MPLPLLSHDQLLTANFFDFRQIVLCKLPKHIWRDVIVSMTKNIADPCYFWPRNFGSSFLYVVREMTTRFGNDFNSALNQPALFPILFESFKSHAIQYATNAFDRFNDISETWRDDSFGHQKISTAASSIRFLNRGCKLLRVMISVLPPRMLAARSFTSISSNRPSLPFS